MEKDLCVFIDESKAGKCRMSGMHFLRYHLLHFLSAWTVKIHFIEIMRVYSLLFMFHLEDALLLFGFFLTNAR